MKAVLVMWLMLFTVPTFAEDVVPLQSGEMTPYSGLLVKEARFATFLNSEILVEDLTGRLSIQTRLTENLEKLYVGRLEEAVQKPRWYESPSFNRWLGFGIGVVVSALAVYGGSKLVKAVE